MRNTTLDPLPDDPTAVGGALYLAMAAHDLRAPATAVQGLADLLDQRWDDLADWQRRDMIQRLAGAAAALSELLERTLDRSSIEAQRFTYVFEPFDLGALIRDVVHGATMTEVAGRISVDIPTFLPDVLADPLRQRQILTNLLRNAARHTRNGDAITIRVAIGPEHLEVTIVDEGPGIPRPVIDRVFEPFGGDGTGLGLAICRLLAEAQGGTMTVHSAPGEGATFVYTVPLAR